MVMILVSTNVMTETFSLETDVVSFVSLRLGTNVTRSEGLEYLEMSRLTLLVP